MTMVKTGSFYIPCISLTKVESKSGRFFSFLEFELFQVRVPFSATSVILTQKLFVEGCLSSKRGDFIHEKGDYKV